MRFLTYIENDPDRRVCIDDPEHVYGLHVCASFARQILLGDRSSIGSSTHGGYEDNEYLIEDVYTDIKHGEYSPNNRLIGRFITRRAPDSEPTTHTLHARRQEGGNHAA